MTALPKIEGHIWIGQNPMILDDLAGKVVLVHFWTYSSVNCRRIIPYLREWNEKYKDEGFAIIGIHTPEFEFESNPKNVENAIRELGIAWPVLLDDGYVNWNNFENNCWPAAYLADGEGNVVYAHFGEGSYEETEEKIRESLGIQGKGEIDRAMEKSNEESLLLSTPEAYCGYLRGNIGNDLGYAEEEESFYQAPLDTVREGEITLNGTFFSSAEYAESREEGATLSVSFSAKEVNIVLTSERGGTEIEILFDGFPLDDIRGADVNEESHVLVNRPGVFNLIQNKEIINGVLEIRACKGNFRAYVLTFS